MPSTDLSQAVSDYLAHLAVERALADNTLQAYRRDLDRYLRFCHKRGLTTVEEIDQALISEFARDLARGSAAKPAGSGASGQGQAASVASAEGRALSADSAAEPAPGASSAEESGPAVAARQEPALSAASVNRVISAVRGFHRFLVFESVTPHDPASEVRPPAAKRPLPKALPVNVVIDILDAPDQAEPVGVRDRALLELLYGTGARISEALGLDVDDLDLADGTVLLRGKGSKSRLVPVGRHAREAVEAYLVRARPALAAKGRAGPALFINSQGRRLSRQSAWGILQHAASEAAVSQHVSPHVLRHSFATHLLDGGADVRVVQELLGHASVTTTQIYTLVTVDKLREVYVSTHPRALG